ncbi:MAG: hypothetical protein JRJ73_03535 [Deltaproteobacteria bacterium]|nr:hypothetical protein [Deltaproteobacteria bacterium]MBW2051607.1 hypothetical protein [Deltaproteobacteria bacterium]
MTKKEKELLDRIEKRFARHKGNKIMMALKDISTRYLIKQLKSKDE